MTDQATSVPVDPAESGSELETQTPDLDELTPLSIEGRIARTDAHIIDWRTESVRRREAWEQEQAEALAAAAEQRRRRLVPIIGVSAAASLVLAVSVALWALWPRPAEVAELAPLPTVAAPVAVVEEAVVEVEPVAVVEPTEPEVDVAPAAEPEHATEAVEPEVDAVVPVIAGTLELWQDKAHQWIRFVVDTDEPVWMEWRDATGARVLEGMSCAAPGPDGHICKAGRSHHRIRSALAAGAVAGTWTVEACSTAGCQAVGTFAVP